MFPEIYPANDVLEEYATRDATRKLVKFGHGIECAVLPSCPVSHKDLIGEDLHKFFQEKTEGT